MQMQVAPQSVKLHLDKERVWKFDLNASIALHEELGPDALSQLQTIAGEKEGDDRKILFSAQNLKILRALIWCGLVSESPELTPHQIGAMLQPATLIEDLKPVLEAMSNAHRPTSPAAEKKTTATPEFLDAR